MNLPPWPEMKRLPDRRGISEEEIYSAKAYLGSPDPAGIMDAPSLEEVSFVAIYMAPVIREIVYHSPLWREIFQGHPAARAIYYHEARELAAYETMSIDDPLLIRRPGRIYNQAHARACYEEARYWEAWSHFETAPVAWSAFLQANPLRMESEILVVIDHLSRQWQVSVPIVSAQELEQAREFYRAKAFTREGLNL